MKSIQKKSIKVKEILGLTSSLVGVNFIFSESDIPQNIEKLQGHRYCQALMRARQGNHVILDGDGIACPAAAAAFGFKDLPDGLKTGKGLVGFGIVNQENSGKTMFEGMTTLPQGKLNALYLFPMETAIKEPDVVVAEDETEKLMWLALANLNVNGGKRVESSTAILQATCVDATTIPYIQQKFNMSMGCYGCRDATDICPNETVLGFPFKDFYAIVETIEFLNQKAIPNSRSKNALAALKEKETKKQIKTTMFINNNKTMEAKEILNTKKKYAIIGVSQDETKYSYEVFHLMQEHNYTVYAVNPRYKEINGHLCYPSINELPEKPEVIMVIMAPQNIEKILDNLLQFKDVILWFPPECFSDSIIEKVNHSGLPYVYDTCPVGILKGFAL